MDSRHTYGQYDVHGEIAVPAGEFRPRTNAYAWDSLPQKAGESSQLPPQLYRM